MLKRRKGEEFKLFYSLWLGGNQFLEFKMNNIHTKSKVIFSFFVECGILSLGILIQLFFLLFLEPGPHEIDADLQSQFTVLPDPDF
jgi:hypothetical protein